MGQVCSLYLIIQCGERVHLMKLKAKGLVIFFSSSRVKFFTLKWRRRKINDDDDYSMTNWAIDYGHERGQRVNCVSIYCKCHLDHSKKVSSKNISKSKSNNCSKINRMKERKKKKYLLVLFQVTKKNVTSWKDEVNYSKVHLKSLDHISMLVIVQSGQSERE